MANSGLEVLGFRALRLQPLGFAIEGASDFGSGSRGFKAYRVYKRISF